MYVYMYTYIYIYIYIYIYYVYTQSAQFNKVRERLCVLYKLKIFKIGELRFDFCLFREILIIQNMEGSKPTNNDNNDK